MLWLLCFVLVSRSLECIVMYSSKTTNNLLNEFSEYNLAANLSSLTFQQITDQYPVNGNWILIDLTLCSSFYNILDSLAEYFNTIYLSVTNAEVLSCSRWRQNIHNSYEIEALALRKAISWLNIKNLAILSSSLLSNLKISINLKLELTDISVDYINYEEEISQTVSDLLIGRMIKAKAINKLLIIGNENSLKNIQKSLISKNMQKAGFVYIFTSRSIFSVIINGSLIITEQGLEFAKSYENYELLAIKNALKKLMFDSINDSSSLFLVKDSLFKDPLPYSVVNIQNGVRVISGTIDKELSLLSSIIFPGNISTLIDSKKITLNLWIDNGIQDIYNSYYYPLFNYFYSGAVYAVARSNMLNDIPSFSFNLTTVSCGIFTYESNWYKNCIMPHVNSLPIAYLTSFWYAASIGNMLTLRALNVDIPQISPFSQDESVNNMTEFPEFLKMSASMQNYLTNAMLFMKALGWKEIVIFATDDPTFTVQYKALELYTNYLGIKIVNPVDKRIFPQNYTRNDFEKYKSYFQAAKDTRCRIFLLAVWERDHFWEGLYDVGLRRGDFFTVTETAALTYLNNVNNVNLYKRTELLLDSLVITYREFIGDLGQQLEAEMSAIFPALSYMCMTYDTVSTIKEAIKFLLVKGSDYEDVEALKNAMRNNKFSGCLGNVFFTRGENSIANSKFIMQQIHYNHNKTEMILEDVAYLDTFSAQFITIINNLEWPDTTTNIPTNFRPVPLCPFDTYKIRSSYLPKIVIYIISSALFIISIISANISQKNFKNTYEVLSKKEIVSFSDFVFMLYFFFQFLQYISLGPDQTSYKSLVNNFQVLLSFDFSLYFKVEFEKFWILFSSILGFAAAWVILCVLVTLKCEVNHEKNFFCGKIKYLSELLLPILGHIGLLPIFSMLMNIFMCNNSIGDNLTESYLDQDCTTFCYIGEHKTFMIAALVVISLYLPAAIYTRPIWELTQTSLHIRTKPQYLAVLSLFQVIIVILNKTLKVFSQAIHGYVMCTLIVALGTFTIITNPYNYKKACILQIISLTLSFWGILTASIFESKNLTVWILVEFLGFLVILLVGGILFARSPALLYSKKGADISSLFIFQFCKNYEKYIKDPGSLNFSKSQAYKFSGKPLSISSEQELNRFS